MDFSSRPNGSGGDRNGKRKLTDLNSPRGASQPVKKQRQLEDFFSAEQRNVQITSDERLALLLQQEIERDEDDNGRWEMSEGGDLNFEDFVNDAAYRSGFESDQDTAQSGENLPSSEGTESTAQPTRFTGPQDTIAPSNISNRAELFDEGSRGNPDMPRTDETFNARDDHDNLSDISDGMSDIDLPNAAKPPFKKSKGIDKSLPPMETVDLFFEDLAKKAVKMGIAKKVERFAKSPLRIATMCSGTESPLLALVEISDYLAARGIMLELEHLFSAEIVPFKQAYIERNFHPPMIFRDIRELRNPMATTAYGGPAPVPGNVHILIAGFSCVDFSTLNAKRQRLVTDNEEASEEDTTEGPPRNLPTRAQRDAAKGTSKYKTGESGGTFFAVLDYVEDHQPCLVVLENVIGAPWKEIKDAFVRLGYEAAVLKVNTRNYGIPQVRNRTYMFAVHKKAHLSTDSYNGMVTAWASTMQKLQRPASSEVQAFLLRSSSERLEAELATKESTFDSSTQRGGKDRDAWPLARQKHQSYKEKLGLSSQRAYTQWSESGGSRFPDHTTPTRAAKDLVERTMDMLDLRMAWRLKNHVDIRYKDYIIDLSQNVDRDSADSGSGGLITCVTPCGIQWPTSRGKPVTGLEALYLQGLPIDKIDLSVETPTQLRDLAGNAMTSTVVGTALLAALLVASEAIPSDWIFARGISQKIPFRRVNLQPSNLSPLTPGGFSTLNHDHDQVIPASQLYAWSESTVAHCDCQGTNRSQQLRIFKCQTCNHTACESCKGNPTHVYGEGNTVRLVLSPSEFRSKVLNEIPLNLLVTLDIGMFERAFREVAEEAELLVSEKTFLEAIIPALGSPVRYTHTERRRKWKIIYSSTHAILKLVIYKKEIEWRLFAKADRRVAGNDPIRMVLEQPIARLRVLSRHLMHGTWELCLPIKYTVICYIQSVAELVPSTRNKMELRGFEREMVPRVLSITTDKPGLDDRHTQISGCWQLAPKCGTACDYLYVKVENEEDDPLFLFYDPHLIGDPAEDHFVVSKDMEHLEYGETRDILIRVDNVIREDTPWLPTLSAGEDLVVSTWTFGQWIACTARLEVQHDHAKVCFPDQSRISGLASNPNGDCSTSITMLLGLSIRWTVEKPLRWNSSPWLVIDRSNQDTIMPHFNWCWERAKANAAFDPTWQHLPKPEHEDMNCEACSPPLPQMTWTKGQMAEALEVPTQVAAYERNKRSRPITMQGRIQFDTPGKNCVVFLDANIKALMHRALSKLPGRRKPGDFSVSWRIDRAHDELVTPTLPTFSIVSNSDDPATPHNFPTGAELWGTQERTVEWMYQREHAEISGHSFIEEETEEACFPPLGLRVDVKAQRVTYPRAGLLADEVGCGKTVQMLALIARTHDQAEDRASRECGEGRIPLKATLIMTPPGLMDQWATEIVRFLGNFVKVLTMSSVTALKRCSITDLKRADIILVQWKIPTSPTYKTRFTELSGMMRPPTGTGGSRAHKVWRDQANQSLAQMTKMLKQPNVDYLNFPDVLEQQLLAHEVAYRREARCPSKRSAGAAYIAEPSTDAEVPEHEVRQISGFRAVKILENVRFPVLQMFHFNRYVIDEYHYLLNSSELMQIPSSISASSRWVLSATPQLGDFGEVRSLAALLGVHLGIDRPARGWYRTKKADTSMLTPREHIEWFTTTNSGAWHKNRNEVGQRFLDHFARQNKCDPSHTPPAAAHQLIGVPSTGINRMSYLETQMRVSAAVPGFPPYQSRYGDDLRTRTYKKIWQYAKLSKAMALTIAASVSLHQCNIPDDRAEKVADIYHDINGKSTIWMIDLARFDLPGMQLDELSGVPDTRNVAARMIQFATPYDDAMSLVNARHNDTMFVWKKIVRLHPFASELSNACSQYIITNPPMGREECVDKYRMLFERLLQDKDYSSDPTTVKWMHELRAHQTPPQNFSDWGHFRFALGEKYAREICGIDVNQNSFSITTATPDAKLLALRRVSDELSYLVSDLTHKIRAERFARNVGWIQWENTPKYDDYPDFFNTDDVASGIFPTEPAADHNLKPSHPVNSIDEPSQRVNSNLDEPSQPVNSNLDNGMAALLGDPIDPTLLRPAMLLSQGLTTGQDSSTVDETTATQAAAPTGNGSTAFEGFPTQDAPSAQQESTTQDDSLGHKIDGKEKEQFDYVPDILFYPCDLEPQIGHAEWQDLLLNGSCGHVLCSSCRAHLGEGRCIPHCSRMSQEFECFSCADIGVGPPAAEGGFAPCKIDAIINHIKALGPEAKVIVFAQGELFTTAFCEALGKCGLKYASTIGKSDAMLNKSFHAFKHRGSTLSGDYVQILVLDLDNATAAGHNLTMAKHIIFALPIIARDQEGYDATIRQAIGRAVRPPQTDTVQVTQYLVCDTAEVNIWEKRTGLTAWTGQTWDTNRFYTDGVASEMRSSGRHHLVPQRLIGQSLVDKDEEEEQEEANQSARLLARVLPGGSEAHPLDGLESVVREAGDVVVAVE